MTILLTGATGFVGAALCESLCQQGYPLTAAVRRTSSSLPVAAKQSLIGDLSSDTDWSSALSGINTVIHLAARAHIMRDSATDPLSAFRQTNTVATLHFAQQAADAGVSRFVYISSIKVNGENTGDTPFTPETCFTPSDPYGLSKYEAEQGLMKIAQQTDMEIVIIRPPLIYGAGVKGNFLSLFQWLNSGIPLPLGLIQNQRSLVYIGNLIDLIITCIKHPAAANQVFLVSDSEDISTTELLRCMGSALGKSARLVPVQPKLIELCANLLGKQDAVQRLLGNLQVDISKTKQLLSWEPKIGMNEGLQKTAEWYLEQ